MISQFNLSSLYIKKKESVIKSSILEKNKIKQDVVTSKWKVKGFPFSLFQGKQWNYLKLEEIVGLMAVIH